MELFTNSKMECHMNKKANLKGENFSQEHIDAEAGITRQ